jgi:uncharacterized protein (TIGR02147 family)
MINDPRHLIKETLSERISLNPSYSLRAFARDLKISPQQLSNFLNGKRGISEKVAAHIAQRLGLSEEETARFCQTISAQFSRSKTKKAIATAHLKQFELNEGLTKNLELDFFKTISQWHHLGLMELIKISKNKSSTKLFSKRLGIPETEILMSLQRLERLELITKTAQGWKLNQDTVIADKGIPSEAIRHFHQQLLEKSILALRFQTQDERYGSSTTLPVKVKSVERAKKLLQEFRIRFAEELSDAENGEEVYGLTIQFFRLTQSSENLNSILPEGNS